jgi:hypothetical protein
MLSDWLREGWGWNRGDTLFLGGEKGRNKYKGRNKCTNHTQTILFMNRKFTETSL